MRTFAIAVAALASALVCPGLADAKTTHHPKTSAGHAAKSVTSPVSSDQANAVAELAKAGLSIQADLNGAIAGLSGEEMARSGGDGAVLCFQVLESATVELTGDLKELLVAATTASLAKDPGDLNTSMRFTRLALADVGDSVALVQRVTSEAPSECRSSRHYRDQIGKLQALAHDVTSVTDDLAAATGPQ